MKRTEYTTGRIFIGRLPAGIDLLEGLTRIVNQEEIRVGKIEVYGTVRRLSLRVFNQETRFAETIERESGHEIAVLSGTISQFKRRSLPRLSGVFTDPAGAVVAGTLALGTIAHACEAVIMELNGGLLSRDFDMESGLPLWKSNALLLASTDEDPAADS